jgi:parvulin-like peptidyl-prolyl isomerase
MSIVSVIIPRKGGFVLQLQTKLIFLAFAFSAFATHVPAPRIAAQNDSQALAQHLWQVLKSEIGDTAMTGDAETACRRFIDQGAPKVKDEAAAERDIRRFANEMVKQAKYDEANRHKTIDIAAYKRAYDSVCPLYPFC